MPKKSIKKSPFPKTLMVYEVGTIDDTKVLATAETPDDIDEEFDGEPVAIYQLLAIGQLEVDKQVNGRVIQKFDIKLDNKKRKR